MDPVTIQAPPLAKASVVEPRRSRQDPLPWLFPTIVFLSALLLFQSELILAKYILPWFGGTPAVWNTCMLFYQSVLLAGYAYSHWLSTRFEGRKQTRIHMAAVGIALVAVAITIFLWGSPLTPAAHWKFAFADSPVLHIVVLLTMATGIPFFLLSTTGPLLQDWFGQVYPGQSPYRLYAISNLGSFAALLGYPFLVEWLFPIRRQAIGWAVLFVIFLVLCLVQCRILSRHSLLSRKAETAGAAARAGRTRLAIWIGLATCGSVMLLATTNLVCQNLPSNPFLWAVPLCIYLISFTICFENPRWYARTVFFPLFFVAVYLTAKTIAADPLYVQPVPRLGTYFFLLFTVCMVCNGELERLKPPAERVTPFYLSIAFGGALGGVFVVLAAPYLFHTFFEFQLSIVATAILVLVISARGLLGGRDRIGGGQPPRRLVWLFSVMAAIAALGILGLASRIQARREAGDIVELRNFFGVKRVYDVNGVRSLENGGILHGGQSLDERTHMEPLTYYKHRTGLGILFENYRRVTGRAETAPLRVGVVGMGVGTIAAYGQPGDTIRFYDIDPQIVDLSQGPRPWFTYSRDSRGKVETVVGDARLSLEAEAARHEFQRFDILVLDAFSGDAIPVHLLTSEAMQVYLQHLSGPDTIIVVHISNKAVDLTPVLRALAAKYGFTLMHLGGGLAGPEWVLLCRDQKVLADAAFYRPFPWEDAPVLWTDDYSNLLTVLKR